MVTTKGPRRNTVSKRLTMLESKRYVPRYLGEKPGFFYS
jgi:hypothetical protein